MNAGHGQHTATLLPDGDVIVTGATGQGKQVELYQPGELSFRGSWRTTGTIRPGWFDAAATLLPCGLVLVAGGYSDRDSHAVASAALYDPASESWLPTRSMTQPRDFPAAALLADGRVLVLGGERNDGSAELYDPSSGVWRRTGHPNQSSERASLTALLDGRVLVTGGAGRAAELYDPETETWRSTRPLLEERGEPTVTLLMDGRVLVAGDAWHAAVDAEVYDPIAETWTATKPMVQGWLWRRSATRLKDGRVLVAGGTGDSETPTAESEIYDPATNSWTTTGSLLHGRMAHSATLLPNGMVLAVSGDYLEVPVTAELFEPNSGTWQWAGQLVGKLSGQSATLLPGGSVLVTGADWGSDATAELYVPPPLPPVPHPSAMRLFLPFVGHSNPQRARCGTYLRQDISSCRNV